MHYGRGPLGRAAHPGQVCSVSWISSSQCAQKTSPHVGQRSPLAHRRRRRAGSAAAQAKAGAFVGGELGVRGEGGEREEVVVRADEVGGGDELEVADRALRRQLGVRGAALRAAVAAVARREPGAAAGHEAERRRAAAGAPRREADPDEALALAPTVPRPLTPSVGGGGTRRARRSRRWSGPNATPNSPPVARASSLSTYTSATSETTVQRTFFAARPPIVAWMSPGSHVLRLADSSTSSRETNEPVACSWSFARSSAFWSDASPAQYRSLRVRSFSRCVRALLESGASESATPFFMHTSASVEIGFCSKKAVMKSRPPPSSPRGSSAASRPSRARRRGASSRARGRRCAPSPRRTPAPASGAVCPRGGASAALRRLPSGAAHRLPRALEGLPARRRRRRVVDLHWRAVWCGGGSAGARGARRLPRPRRAKPAPDAAGDRLRLANLVRHVMPMTEPANASAARSRRGASNLRARASCCSGASCRRRSAAASSTRASSRARARAASRFGRAVSPAAPTSTAWGDDAGAVLRARRRRRPPRTRSTRATRAGRRSSRPCCVNEVLDALHGGAHAGSGAARRRRASAGSASFPTSPELVWRAPDAASGAWHIDGGTDTLDTTQSVVVLPLVTTIRAGGGGTALLAQSHAQVAAFLHGKGERGRRSVDRKIGELVADGLAARNGLRVVEATGAAGDVLVMHPLLVHASSPASRTTLAQSEDGRWACVKHGIRVTFNLSTLWRQPPLRVPADPASAPPLGSLVEQSLVDAVAGARPAAGCVRYGEEVQLRFVASDAVATAGLDGVVRATPQRRLQSRRSCGGSRRPAAPPTAIPCATATRSAWRSPSIPDSSRSSAARRRRASRRRSTARRPGAAAATWSRASATCAASRSCRAAGSTCAPPGRSAITCTPRRGGGGGPLRARRVLRPRRLPGGCNRAPAEDAAVRVAQARRLEQFLVS